MENKQNKTIEELLYDDLCKKFIKEWIVEVKKKRHEAVVKSKNGLKKGPFDAIVSKGLLNSENLIEEYKLIIFKQSKLPSSERALIDGIVSDALIKTIAFYNEQSTQKKNQVQL